MNSDRSDAASLVKKCLAILAVIITPLLSPTASAEPNWPTKPITLIVPFGAGGTTDLPVRVVAEKLSQLLGKPVVTDFRPGAGTVIGTQYVAKAKPDGYTLLVMATSHATNAALGRSLPYDVRRDFELISQFLTTAQVIMVPPDSKIQSVGDLVAAARKAPGKLNYGAPALNSSHFVAELFKSAADLDITYIGYKSTADIAKDLATNRIQLFFETATTATGSAKSGLAKPIAVTSPQRLKALPNVPTVREAGVSGFEFSAWMGLAAPKGTPPEILSKLERAMAATAALPDVRERFGEIGSEAVHVSGNAFASLFDAEVKKFAVTAKSMKVDLN